MTSAVSRRASARPDRRRQREEPEARPGRAARRRVPDARGRERRRGDRARGRAPAGRDPDGPPAAGHGRRGGRAGARGGRADGADPGRRAELAAARGDERLARAAGSPATSRSRSASASSRTRCAATAPERTVLAPRDRQRTVGAAPACVLDRQWTGRLANVNIVTYRLRGEPNGEEARAMRTLLIGGALAALVVCSRPAAARAGARASEQRLAAARRTSGRSTRSRGTSTRRRPRRTSTLMMSLWAPNATFTFGPGQTATGKDADPAGSGSTKSRRSSRAPLGLRPPRVQGRDHGQRRPGHAALRVPLHRHRRRARSWRSRPPTRMSRGSTDGG